MIPAASIRVVCCNTRSTATSLAFYARSELEFELNMCDWWKRLCLTSMGKSPERLENVVVTSRRHEAAGGLVSHCMNIFHTTPTQSGYKIRLYGPRPLLGPTGSLQTDYFFERHIIPYEDANERMDRLSWFQVSDLYSVSPIYMRSQIAGDPLNFSYVVAPMLAKGSCLAFLSVPSVAYIQSLLDNKCLWDALSLHTNVPFPVNLVYHSAPYEVITDPLYGKLIDRFTLPQTHLFDCAELNHTTFLRGENVMLTNKANDALPTLFPCIKPDEDRRQRVEQRRAQLLGCISREDVVKCGFPKPGDEIALDEKPVVRPTVQTRMLEQTTKLVSISARKNVVSHQIDLNDQLAAMRREAKPGPKDTMLFFNEPFFAFLGTGLSRGIRATSGIYVNIPGSNMVKQNELRTNPAQLRHSHGILLDCGEGTFGQLRDHFGTETGAVLAGLKMIYLTHDHTDHSLGLPQLLCEWDRVGGRGPLFVLVPRGILDMMREQVQYHRLKNAGLIRMLPTSLLNIDPEPHYSPDINVHNVDAKQYSLSQIQELILRTYEKNKSTLSEFLHFIRDEAKLKSFYGFETNHTTDSQAAVLEGQNWKVVYPGDTAPCDTVPTFSRGANLLIHECTYTNDSKQYYNTLKHSTLPDVLQVIKLAGPWRTVITHLSRGIDRNYLESMKQHDRIVMAEDHMHFGLSDLSWMPRANLLLNFALNA